MEPYYNMKTAAWNYDDLWLGSAFSNRVFFPLTLDDCPNLLVIVWFSAEIITQSRILLLDDERYQSVW